MLILGAPVVKWGEEIIHIQRNIPRALLYYLAGHPQPISRAALCLLLWPDAPDEIGRRRLREILSKLRADLPDAELLITENDQVSLDSERVLVDLLEFQELINQHRHTASLVARNQPLPERIYLAFKQAVEYWRGPRLLSGFDLPESEDYRLWVEESNRMLDLSHQFALLRLADHATACADLQEALHWLQKAVEVNEHNSDFHYRILNTLASLGRVEQIANYCDYLTDLYRPDGGLPAMLTDLCTKLRSVGGHSSYPLPAPHFPMIGRGYQLNRLQQIYLQGGVAAILGEAGAGKTRLTYEFFRSLDPSPRLFLLSCQENFRSLPFHPIIAGLRQQIHLDEWQLLTPAWRANLSLLLPELQTSLSEPPLSHKFGLDDTRTQIYESLFQFACLMETGERLVAVLEDAQWADNATLNALAYLIGRGLFKHPNLLIVNTRLEEQNQDLKQFLNNQPKGSNLEIIHLPLLDQAQIAEFCQSVLGEALSAKQLERLALDTGGNPLYILEWLQNWNFYRSQTPPAVVSSGPIMGSFLSLMRDRLKILNSTDRQVLSAAAVLGNQFQPDEVETLTELSSAAVTMSLENLEQARLICPLEDGIAYSFIHDKIREVLLMELTVARKRSYHLRAAAMLQQKSPRQDNPDSARIAAHYEAGGEPARAIHAWVDAAMHARRMFSRPEAEAALQRAEQITKAYEHTLPDEAIYYLYATWGHWMIESSNPQGMQRNFSLLLNYGKQRHNRLMMGVAQRGLANYFLQIGQLEAAREAADQSVLLLESLPHLQERVDALFSRASVLIILGEYATARQDLETAIEISAHTTEREILRSRSLSEMVLAIQYALTGQLGRSEQMGWQAHQDARRIHSMYAESNALVALSMATYYQGKFEECDQLIRKGLSISEPLHYWRNVGYLQNFKSFLCMSMGDLDSAWLATLETQKNIEKYNTQDLLASYWLMRGNLFGYLRDVSSAIDCYKKGQALAIDFHMSLENQAQLARTLVSSGDLQEGGNQFEQVLSTSKRVGLGLIYFRAAVNWLALRSAIQTPEQILMEADELENEIGDLRIAPLLTLINLSRATAYLKTGNTDRGFFYANLFEQEADRSKISSLDFTYLYSHKQIAALSQQPLNPGVRARILQRLQHLEQHTHQPELRPLFDNFQAKILADLQ